MTICITLPKPNLVIKADGRSLERKDYPAISTWKYYSRYQDLLDLIPDDAGGVYIIHTSDDVLYVGRSIRLKYRVGAHLAGNVQSIRPYLKSITKVECIYIEDVSDQEIYEAYAIKTLNPTINTAKTNRNPYE